MEKPYKLQGANRSRSLKQNTISKQTEIDKFVNQSHKTPNRDIDAFLNKVRQMAPQVGGRTKGRLIFAMDATASREPTWDRASHIQAEMFRETANLGGLEIQLAYYRGFGEFRCSTWMNDADKLLRQMTAVHCLGGQTQIEKLLWHAEKETQQQKVQALVFIGDAFEEDIDRVCKAAGRLGVLGVPTFCFHEGRDPIAQIGLKQLAKLTKGAYCPFDSSSKEQLRELLSAAAVFAAGGRKALDQYSEAKGGGTLLLSHQLKNN